MHLNASPDEISGCDLEGTEGPLNAIVHVAQQAGPQFHGKRRMHRNRLHPRHQSHRILIDLNGSLAPIQRDDLPDQPIRPHFHLIPHLGGAHSLCKYHGAVYPGNYSGVVFFGHSVTFRFRIGDCGLKIGTPPSGNSERNNQSSTYCSVKTGSTGCHSEERSDEESRF